MNDLKSYVSHTRLESGEKMRGLFSILVKLNLWKPAAGNAVKYSNFRRYLVKLADERRNQNGA